ncbi:MAG TPA: carboxymuconolactone decarboxylase family protein [Candidatus Binatia bacterium]|nr:carboxymuconolactone decarboxylase family protein [Candidatus Binatia bacterium]
MNRITQLDPTAATGKSKQLFEEVQAKLGIVPNVLRVLANAPAALEGYLRLSDALAGGNFNARVREQIALAVAGSNLCAYSLAAHAFFGGRAGLTEKEIVDAGHAVAVHAKTDAILKLARNVVVERGEVSDAELDQAHACGLTDGEIVETVANVVLNILTNYVSHVAGAMVDFGEAKLSAANSNRVHDHSGAEL